MVPDENDACLGSVEEYLSFKGPFNIFQHKQDSPLLGTSAFGTISAVLTYFDHGAELLKNNAEYFILIHFAGYDLNIWVVQNDHELHATKDLSIV